MENNTVYDPAESRRLMELAESALTRGDLAGAVGALETALAADPYNEEIPLAAAALQLQAGDPIRAAHLAADSLAIRPFNPGAVEALGVACLDALQSELGRRILTVGRSMAPANENIVRHLADVDRRIEEIEQAEVPEKERMTAAQLLPRKAIDRILSEREPTLTACVVLLDDQLDSLDACIDSIRSVATGILLIDARRADTRPMPATVPSDVVTIATDLTALPRIYEEAYRQASGDWVLMIEANEILAHGSDEVLLAAMCETGTIGHLIEIHDSEGCARRTIRLLRNAAGVHFMGRMNPRPAGFLASLRERWGLTLDDIPAEIHRDAALRSPFDCDERQATLALLDSDLAGDPDNLEASLERAWVEAETGMCDEALEVVDRLRKLHARRDAVLMPDVEEAVTLEGRCMLRLGRIDELAAAMLEHHETFPPTANTLFLQGAAARAAGRNREAIDLFVQALELDGHVGVAPNFPELRGPGLPNLIGAMWMERGELEQAREAFEFALSRDADNVESRIGLIGLRQEAGQIEEVLQDLDRLVDRCGDDPRVWLAGDIVLRQLPRLATITVDWLSEASSRLPEHAEIRFRLAQAQMSTGQADAAIQTWSTLPTEQSAPFSARVAAALVDGSELPAVPDGEAGESVGFEVLGWFQQWLETGAYQALDQALLNISRAEPALPGLAEVTASWLDQEGQNEAATCLRRSVRPEVTG